MDLNQTVSAMDLNNVTHLETSPAKNDTSVALDRYFSSRQRISKETNLDQLRTILLRAGVLINPSDFQTYFKKLEEDKKGIIRLGRGANPTRFEWHSSMKAVASDSPIVEPIMINKKRQYKGRPKGAKDLTPRVRRSRAQLVASPSQSSASFNRSEHMKKMWQAGKMGRKTNAKKVTKDTLQALIEKLNIIAAAL